MKNKKRKLKSDETVEEDTSLIRGAHKIDIVTEHTKPLTKTQARFLALRPKKDMKAMGDAMEAMVSLCTSPSPRENAAGDFPQKQKDKSEFEVTSDRDKPLKKRAVPSKITVPEG